MTQAKRKNTTLWKFFITTVILSFLGGFILATNFGCFSGDQKQETQDTAKRSAEEGQNGNPAHQISQAFKDASLKASPSVVSIITQQLGYENESGVVVTSVISGGPASRAGLQRGDLIKEVDRKPVRTEDDFENAIKGLKEGAVVALLVRRGQNTFFATVTIPQ